MAQPLDPAVLNPPAASPARASAQLVRALQRRLGAELIETHISWVLLAGDEAWKIKKPVHLPFLDFSTLAQRRHFCDEELRLNRRHAPSIYLGVVPITGTPLTPQLGGVGVAIEFALHMRRFAPRALLSERLADGLLQPVQIDALAQRMAALHVRAAVAPPGSAWGSAGAVAAELRDVLQRLHDQHQPVADLQRWAAAESTRLTPVWRARQAGGFVRECHGDLHLRNAVVLVDGPTAFDAIEFDPALRWIDVQSDLAFMAMDLHAHGRSDLAWRFVNAGLDASGDHAGVAVLRCYTVYRALVRAMVGHLHAQMAPEPSADHYLALARRLALSPPTPRLLVTHGLAGSGKTQLTQQLLQTAGALRLRSDVERKRLFGLAPLDDSPARVSGGIYGARATQRTYAALLERARSLLQAGGAVIVDAAFLRRAERARFARLALELGVPFTLLDCQAAHDTLRERVRARRLRRDDASEADEAVLALQIDCDQPLTAAERRQALTVQTDDALDVDDLARCWLAQGARQEPQA